MSTPPAAADSPSTLRTLLVEVVTQLDVAIRRRPVGSESAAHRRLGDAAQLLRADYPEAFIDADRGLAELFEPAADQRWEALRSVFRLSSVEERLLRVAVAPELDPQIGAVFALLSGGSARPTVALALELAGIGFLSAQRSVLGPAGTLSRSSLLAVEGDAVFLDRTLRVPDRLVEHLLGSDDADHEVGTLAVTVVPVRTAESLALHRFLERGHAFCYVHESAQSAALATAAAAFTESGIRWTAVDCSRLDDAQPAISVLRRTLLEAGLAGCALVVGGCEVLAAREPTAIRLLTEAAVPVIACGTAAWQATWSHDLPPIVRARPLDDADARELWSYALGGDAQRLLAAGWSAPALRPEEILHASRLALDNAENDDVAISIDLIAEAARHAAPPGATPGLIRRTPRATRADLVLPVPSARAVDELIGWVRHRSQVLGGGRKVGKGSRGDGITALFTGGSGTGKTLAAEVVAHELGLDLLTVELPTVIDKYIGETEKNLERIFAAAEEAGALLFFDEADALFGSRSSVSDSRDRYANQEVAFLLQRMEVFSGTAILATNLRGNLDPAFTRRLHFVISFLDPDPAMRRRLWLAHLADVPHQLSDDPAGLDLLVAQADFSGGAIRNVVVAAAFAAAIEHVPVEMRHLRTATVREFDKLGRRIPAGLSPV